MGDCAGMCACPDLLRWRGEGLSIPPGAKLRGGASARPGVRVPRARWQDRTWSEPPDDPGHDRTADHDRHPLGRSRSPGAGASPGLAAGRGGPARPRRGHRRLPGRAGPRARRERGLPADRAAGRAGIDRGPRGRRPVALDPGPRGRCRSSWSGSTRSAYAPRTSRSASGWAGIMPWTPRRCGSGSATRSRTLTAASARR